MIVKYSKKFPYAPYLNEDIGFEDSISDNASEEEMIASLRRLSEVALKFHKENNPESIIYRENPEWVATNPYPPMENKTIPEIDRNAIDRLEKLIDDSTTLEQLQGYKKDVEKIDNKDLYDLYNNKVMDLV